MRLEDLPVALADSIRAVQAAGYRVRFAPSTQTVFIVDPSTNMTVRTVPADVMVQDHLELEARERKLAGGAPVAMGAPAPTVTLSGPDAAKALLASAVANTAKAQTQAKARAAGLGNVEQPLPGNPLLLLRKRGGA